MPIHPTAPTTPPTIRTAPARPDDENDPIAALYASIRGSLANALVAAARGDA